jgi:hypothetical protein
VTQIPNWRELMVYNPPVQQRAPKAQPQAVAQHKNGSRKFRGSVAAGYDDKREPTDKWKVEQRIIEGMLAELPAKSSVLDCPVGTGRFLRCYVKNQLDFIGMDLSGDMLVRSAWKLNPEDAKRWVDDCGAWVARAVVTNEEGKPVLDKAGRTELTGEEISISLSTLLPIGSFLPVGGKVAQLGVRDEKLRALEIEGKGILLPPADILRTGLPDKHVDVSVACRITRWMIEDHGPEGIVAMLRELQRITRSKIIVTARVYGHRFAVTEDLITSALDGWKITRNVPGYEMAYRIIMLEPA